MSNTLDMIERIKKSNMHEKLGGEQLTAQAAAQNGELEARKAAASKKLATTSQAPQQNAPTVRDGVGDTAAKLQANKGGGQDVVTGDGGGGGGGGDGTGPSTLEQTTNTGDLAGNIQKLGSTSSSSGAMNGAMQAGAASGGNPYAMAAGAVMGIMQSKENRQKAMQMVEQSKILEDKKAEERKQKAMGDLQSNIGTAFRSATKSVSF